MEKNKKQPKIHSAKNFYKTVFMVGTVYSVCYSE